jgi:lipid II:glycine glycyltransferase (peptidoglycan interpeptide bridge formation enzyme)
MSNKELYRQFCSAGAALPIFLKDWWLDAVCPDWDVTIVKNGDKISGVWPYSIERKINVTILRDQVLTPYMGPFVFYPADLKASKRDSFQHETLTALLEAMPDAKVWHVSTLPGLKQAGLLTDYEFDIQLKQTFIMPLDEPVEHIFNCLHEDYRRNVRKAEKELTITNEPEMLHQLWGYQKATLDRKNVRTLFTQQQMQKIFDACIKHNSAALWVAKKGDEMQAIVWHVWDDEKGYYLMGSNNPHSKDNRAMTALLWHAIQHTKILGKSGFDFEGSMDPGVEKFFRNFGGKRELYLVLRKNESLLWKLKERLR